MTVSRNGKAMSRNEKECECQCRNGGTGMYPMAVGSCALAGRVCPGKVSRELPPRPSFRGRERAHQTLTRVVAHAVNVSRPRRAHGPLSLLRGALRVLLFMMLVILLPPLRLGGGGARRRRRRRSCGWERSCAGRPRDGPLFLTLVRHPRCRSDGQEGRGTGLCSVCLEWVRSDTDVEAVCICVVTRMPAHAGAG